MRLFQELDTDSDGIIDEAAFEALYRRINFILDGQGHRFSDHEQQEISDLKRAIDPCATNKLVLSDIIQAFMTHSVGSQAASGETSQSQIDLLARDPSRNEGRGTGSNETQFQSRDYRVASEKEAETENLPGKMKLVPQHNLIQASNDKFQMDKRSPILILSDDSDKDLASREQQI